MKPISLILQGFKSHLERTEIGFEGRSLTAIVGPVGSGKSSILDGICYALYGQTPKVGKETKGLISSRSASAEIELRFEADGRVFTVERQLRRSGSGPVVLIDDAGDKLIGKREVDKRIEELLGLDFKAFCSSVILPQGQFARFLESDPVDRTKLLKGVFRLEKLDDMREHAKGRLAELDAELRAVAKALESLPADAEERLEKLQDDAAGSQQRAAELGVQRPVAAALAEKAAAAQVSLGRARERIEQLERLSVPEADAIRELARREDELTGPRAEAAAAVDRASEGVDAAEVALAAVLAEVGSQRDLARLRALEQKLLDLQEDVARRDEELGSLAQRSESARAVADRARRAEAEALRAFDAAAAQAAELATRHSAHALRSALVPGEPCPVCEQQVVTVPKPGRLPAVERSQDRVREARARLEEARAAAVDAGLGEVASVSAWERAQKELVTVVARLDQVEADLRSGLGDVADLSKELDEREARLAAAELSLTESKMSLVAATTGLREIESRSKDLEDLRRSLRDDLLHIGGALGLERLELGDASELAHYRSEIAAFLAKALAAERDSESVSLDAARAVIQETEALEKTLKFPLTALDREWEAAMRRAAESAAAAGALERQIAGAREMGAKASVVAAQRDTYLELVEDLRDSRFVAFVLEDKRRLLCQVGSIKLMELTDRYRFDDTGEFRIVDTFDGDKERAVSSLSGGETFLASLALALALAEAVGREGGRMGCFFLDEGFGSLDPEALDVALNGIEKIVSEDRLIALVSHVPALAQRIEDKIVLDRSPSGNTLVLSGATRV